MEETTLACDVLLEHTFIYTNYSTLVDMTSQPKLAE
jgi:hypothetical protein